MSETFIADYLSTRRVASAAELTTFIAHDNQTIYVSDPHFMGPVGTALDMLVESCLLEILVLNNPGETGAVLDTWEQMLDTKSPSITDFLTNPSLYKRQDVQTAFDDHLHFVKKPEEPVFCLNLPAPFMIKLATYQFEIRLKELPLQLFGYTEDNIPVLLAQMKHLFTAGLIKQCDDADRQAMIQSIQSCEIISAALFVELALEGAHQALADTIMVTFEPQVAQTVENTNWLAETMTALLGTEKAERIRTILSACTLNNHKEPLTARIRRNVVKHLEVSDFHPIAPGV